mgnify:CR=1 FL=1
MNDKARAGVYILAAVYMFYMAYQIFTSRMDNGGSDYTLMMIFSAFFILCGIGLLIFVIYMMKKNEKK